jgi:hypothetical protein
MIEGVAQGVPFSLTKTIVSDKASRTRRFGNLPRPISAIIRHDIDVEQLFRVIHAEDTLDRLGHDGFLIVGRDGHDDSFSGCRNWNPMATYEKVDRSEKVQVQHYRTNHNCSGA